MNPDLIFKSFSIDLKALTEEKLAKGELDVVFATMGVWDKDGDLALPGFYGEQDIAFLPTHDWSHVPLGKGRTYEQGNEARAKIKLNLDIQAAKDWLSAIKFDLANGRPIQEYSYGFKVLEGGSEMGEQLGRRGRILKPREDATPGSKIWEVSPVLVGAGEKTRTLSAKSAAGAGKTFADESQAVLDAVDGLVVRAKALAALRESEGRELSAPNRERLAALAGSLQEYAKTMTSLAVPAPAAVATPSAEAVEARRELVRMAKRRAGLQ
ncbi:MAG: hypothetical protein PHS14_02845 [Elusimicrobia bacterium]|nr:hypothetical protein [Elusimicrobiota bacterium]